MLRRPAILLLALAAALGVLADYEVRRPSDALRPQAQGARPGEWTLDVPAAQTQAEAAGRGRLLLFTGSWWCPHCQALERQVLTTPAWREFVRDRGYYLSMLDFPYRGAVPAAEARKSVFPELGAGWGFSCWLFDADYLALNGLTAAEGLSAVEAAYARQDELAPATASTVTIRGWRDDRDITYRRVGYPTVVVYLPDGREAGRFSLSREDVAGADAPAYVIAKIGQIEQIALDADCGLCAGETDEPFDASAVHRYQGWLDGPAGALPGSIEVRTGKANARGLSAVSASVRLAGRTTRFSARRAVGTEALELTNGAARLTLRLGFDTLYGTARDAAGRTYAISGARDCFSARDAVSRARAAAAPTGSWTVVLTPEAPVAGPMRGYGAVTVTLRRNGVAGVRGWFGDGQPFSQTARLVAGADGAFCLPLVLEAYPGKSGGAGCRLWFRDGRLMNVADATPWISPQGAIPWRPVYTATAFSEPVAGDSVLEPVDALAGGTVAGRPVLADLDGTPMQVGAVRLADTVGRVFQAKVARRTGQFQGTAWVPVDDGGRGPRKMPLTVRGAFLGATGYATLRSPDGTGWRIRITSCSACSD